MSIRKRKTPPPEHGGLVPVDPISDKLAWMALAAGVRQDFDDAQAWREFTALPLHHRILIAIRTVRRCYPNDRRP